jgi:hypothetical protein
VESKFASSKKKKEHVMDQLSTWIVRGIVFSEGEGWKKARGASKVLLLR